MLVVVITINKQNKQILIDIKDNLQALLLLTKL